MSLLISLLVNAVFLLIVIGLLFRQRSFARRLLNVENETGGRLDDLDAQVSQIGADVIVLQKLGDPNRKQGMRELGHNYDGTPFSPIFTSKFEDEPRRSGEMYVTHPELLVPGTKIPEELIPPPAPPSEDDDEDGEMEATC